MPVSIHSPNPISVNAPKKGNNLRIADAQRANRTVTTKAARIYHNGDPYGPNMPWAKVFRYKITSMQLYIQDNRL